MDLTISEMMQMQRNLYALHAHEWSPMEPEYGKDSLLYMIEEVGEVIAILKKKNTAVMEDPAVRSAFLEEMGDVMMYYTDTLLRYHVTPEEISGAYLRKYAHNMGRNYTKEYEELYHNG